MNVAGTGVICLISTVHSLARVELARILTMDMTRGNDLGRNAESVWTMKE